LDLFKDKREEGKMKKTIIKDIKKIMSVEEEMIRLLYTIEDDKNIINPWVNGLSRIFDQLDIKKGDVILDIPCGKGGVSVPLAKKYKARVLGYDILPEYTKQAKKFASESRVGNLCRFELKDIRKIVKKKNICNLLLWIAPPHLWKNSKLTIANLRNCVKNNGAIFIGDAYLYKKTKLKKYEGYETLEEMDNGLISYGDEIIKFVDYKGKLWKEDYKKTKKQAKDSLRKAENIQDKKIIKRYLDSLEKDEKRDTKYLGLAIWIIRVREK
jgi:SAM-dependent methyltransferase